MTDIKKVVEGLEEITRYDGKQMSLGDNDVFIRGMAQEAIDVLNEQKQKIEEQEKKIEDQEERIAIMSEGGWISVNDAMPDDYREVWVWTKGHLIDFGCHQNDYWLLNSFPSPENDRNSFVTHWQYKMIPEPPKEGEQ